MMKESNVARPEKLDKIRQISFRSTPEIISELDLAAAKLATMERFDGRKLRTGHVANALAVWVASIEDMQELRATIAPMLRALERKLEGGTAVLDAKPRGAHGVSNDPPRADKRKRA